MFFHPCRDVRQAAWDPCSYRWVIWLKREIELCVISVAMVGEAMCLYDGSQWCSVCGEEEGSKNRSLRNPSDQLMCFGYLPSPGHPERPTGEIGFKPQINCALNISCMLGLFKQYSLHCMNEMYTVSIIEVIQSRVICFCLYLININDRQQQVY